jgi:hypothetical protein
VFAIKIRTSVEVADTKNKIIDVICCPPCTHELKEMEITAIVVCSVYVKL